MKKLFIATLVIFFSSIASAHAANLSNLDGLTTATQFFIDDVNVRMTNSGTQNHVIGWLGRLSVGRGGTGRGTLAAGQILFGDTAASISQSAQLFWDRTNSRLGIGTNTPSSKLTVSGGVSIGGNYASVSAPTNGLIVQGSVGIGIITPAYKLDVNGDVHATQVVTNTVSAVGTNQSIRINPTGTGKVIIGGDSLVVASKSSEPTNPQIGQIYFDTTLGKFRGYDGSSWVSFTETTPTTNVRSLVVGGGGGSEASGGGGGGGGVVYEAAHAVSVQVYTVTIGTGGIGGINGAGTKGADTMFDTIIAGGGGVGRHTQSGGTGNGRVTNGSGGGNDYNNVANGSGNGTGGNGGLGQNDSSNYPGGGGGGAGGDGASASGGQGANGGVGVSNDISGSSVFYGGGGGSGIRTGAGTPGTGGAGGGGDGMSGADGENGTPNTGGGGGGSGMFVDGWIGGDGGSGIAIIRYPTGSLTATGGTITTSGGDTIHTFTADGTFTVTAI